MFNYLHAVAFITVLALPLAYFVVVWRTWPRVGLVSLVLYLVSYLLLTLSGSYAVANYGGNDWRREWLPKYLMVEYVSLSGRTKSNITLAGAVYWPCILVDRLVWHGTVTV